MIQKNRVQTFFESLEEQKIFVLETEWTNDSCIAKIDLSYLSELDNRDSKAMRRKKIDKDRVLYTDKQFIIQHPYEQLDFNKFTSIEEFPILLPDENVVEIKITDKTILKACEKKFEDNWLPCDGACGDPEHLEFREVEVYSGWIYDGQNLLFTDSKQELSALVRKALEEIPKIVESVSYSDKEQK